MKDVVFKGLKVVERHCAPHYWTNAVGRLLLILLSGTTSFTVPLHFLRHCTSYFGLL